MYDISWGDIPEEYIETVENLLFQSSARVAFFMPRTLKRRCNYGMS